MLCGTPFGAVRGDVGFGAFLEGLLDGSNGKCLRPFGTALVERVDFVGELLPRRLGALARACSSVKVRALPSPIHRARPFTWIASSQCAAVCGRRRDRDPAARWRHRQGGGPCRHAASGARPASPLGSFETDFLVCPVCRPASEPTSGHTDINGSYRHATDKVLKGEAKKVKEDATLGGDYRHLANLPSPFHVSVLQSRSPIFGVRLRSLLSVPWKRGTRPSCWL